MEASPMCGRFYADENMVEEILKVVRYADQRLREWKAGRDVYPAQAAPVIRGRDAELSGELFIWGFPGFQGKGVIFNARQETAFEKTMFRDSMEHRRCVIPVNSFYEWDRDKNRFTFTEKGKDVMYLAGCYNTFQGEERFVILTDAANDSMLQVHDRMPLIIEQDEIHGWIFSREQAALIQKRKSSELNREGEYFQERLPFDLLQ